MTPTANLTHIIFVLETLLARIELNPRRAAVYVYRAKLELAQ